jgi:salicylate hydroxylase
MDVIRTRVAVVGAGIAGLTVAAALARAGIRAELFEQAGELSEVGAGLQLSPNATRLLSRLGLAGHLEEVATRPEAVEMRRWDTGELLMSSELGAECEARYGAAYYAVHRADLLRGLRELVPEQQIHLAARCTGLSEHTRGVELRFEDGTAATAEVVIGADGIHSVVRDLLASDQPRFSGQTVYRGLVPGGSLPDLVATPKVTIWLGPGQHCVHYPISGGKLISFAATTPVADWRGESWTAPARVEAVVSAYAAWHHELTSVLTAADAVTRWALHDRDPTPRWSTGRVTLVGDAAHPMLPFGAQGAAQAVEDAVALAACLRTAAAGPGAPSPSAIAAALTRYERVRRGRTDTVQRTMRENAKNHHYSDGAHQQRRDQDMVQQWSLGGHAWLYGYDAESAVASG